MSVPLALRTLRSAAEFARALDAVACAGDPSAPIPLLASAALDRQLAALERAGIAASTTASSQPSFAAAFRADGLVAFGTGELDEPLARTLALYSGRQAEPYARPAPGTARDRDVTLVLDRRACPPAFLAAQDPDASLGLFVARDAAAWSALLLRTLTWPLVGRDGLVHADGLRAEADEPSAERWNEVRLRAALAAPSLVASVAAHGRECYLSLGGGVICGRSGGIGGGAGRHLTSCEQGEGCCRERRDPDSLLRASDLAAGIVVADTCAGLQLADSLFSADTSLALSVLDGDAVAFVSSVWCKNETAYAGPLVHHLVAGGASLGGAVKELNRCLAAAKLRIGPFVLLGDAGLVPCAGAGAGHAIELHRGLQTLPASAASALLVRAAGEADQIAVRGGAVYPVVVPRGESEFYLISEAPLDPGGVLVELREESRIALLRDRIVPATEALRLLRHAKIDNAPLRVAELERRLIALEGLLPRARPAPSESVGEADLLFARVRADLDEIQRTVLERLLERTVRTSYVFHDGLFKSLETTHERRTACPYCAMPEARRIELRHRTFGAFRTVLETCALCGEISEGTWLSGLTLRLAGPLELARGTAFEQTLHLRNDGLLPLSGYVAFCWSYEALHETRARQMEPLALAPGESAAYRFAGAIPSPNTTADLHTLRAMVLAEGRLQIVSKYVGVRR